MFHSTNNRSVFQDDDRDGKHRRKSKDYGSNFDDQQGSSSRHRDVRFSFVEAMSKHRLMFLVVEIENET